MRESCYGPCVVFKDEAEATPLGGVWGGGQSWPWFRQRLLRLAGLEVRISELRGNVIRVAYRADSNRRGTYVVPSRKFPNISIG